jgi:glycosyltransferase involved in cell wall biosynthesis
MAMDTPRVLRSLVSICIPTYNRPDLLNEAIESCFGQTYREFEILVGDDSSDERSQTLCGDWQLKHPGRIRYIRNSPPLGQNGNVNMLFSQAVGDRLVLLHDDDLLLPNALLDLNECWITCPDLDAAFGRQQVISMDGKLLTADTERLNRALNRTEDRAGLQKFPVEAGLLHMFPQNGYLIVTEVARKIGYRSLDVVGDACDYDFSLRLCLSGVKLFFHFGYMSSYRYTDISISRSSLTGPTVHRLLKGITVPEESSWALGWAKQHAAWTACPDYARLGDWREALSIIFSSDYAARGYVHRRFLFDLALILGAWVSGNFGASQVEKFLRRLKPVLRRRGI